MLMEPVLFFFSVRFSFHERIGNIKWGFKCMHFIFKFVRYDGLDVNRQQNRNGETCVKG
jgi:hypothetical protein